MAQCVSVGQFIDKLDFLTADQLAVDHNVQHGQLIGVIEQNVLHLIAHFESNKPDGLQLIVVLDRGKVRLLSMLSALLLCCPLS